MNLNMSPYLEYISPALAYDSVVSGAPNIPSFDAYCLHELIMPRELVLAWPLMRPVKGGGWAVLRPIGAASSLQGGMTYLMIYKQIVTSTSSAGFLGFLDDTRSLVAMTCFSWLQSRCVIVTNTMGHTGSIHIIVPLMKLLQLTLLQATKNSPYRNETANANPFTGTGGKYRYRTWHPSSSRLGVAHEAGLGSIVRVGVGPGKTKLRVPRIGSGDVPSTSSKVGQGRGAGILSSGIGLADVRELVADSPHDDGRVERLLLALVDERVNGLEGELGILATVEATVSWLVGVVSVSVRVSPYASNLRVGTHRPKSRPATVDF